MILTRYQAGVSSVTYEEANQRELINNWLKRICCKIKNVNGNVADTAEYQQVLESALEEKESSDEGEVS